MELILERQHGTKDYTAGRLSVDGKFFCYTLEDQENPVKVYGRTAIPMGRYEVVITDSPRFKRKLPLLLDVPNYKGVRIHPGNRAEDTEGCILVGDYDGNDKDAWLGNSRLAFNRLFELLSKTLKKEEVFIKII